MSLEAISKQLTTSGIDHVVVSAAKYKVTTKIEFPKGLDQLISDYREGNDLRNRWSISDPTRLKFTNAVSRMINDPSYWDRPTQRPSLTWSIRLFQFGNTMSAPDVFRATYIVQLVDKKTRKPIYAESDITGPELEIVGVKA